MLAAKCALATRYDALADESSTAMGLDQKTKLEQRIRFLESGKSKGISKPTRSSYPGDTWTNRGEVRFVVIVVFLQRRFCTSHLFYNKTNLNCYT